jgi:hypothetical protein
MTNLRDRRFWISQAAKTFLDCRPHQDSLICYQSNNNQHDSAALFFYITIQDVIGDFLHIHFLW